MQIILASAKIMNDRSATKGDACQSKKVKSSPDISLSSPRFQNEADCFARDMAQYSAETMTRFIIENRIDKPEDLFAFSYEGFIYEPKLGERLRVGERSSGIPDFPHFIMQ